MKSRADERSVHGAVEDSPKGMPPPTHHRYRPEVWRYNTRVASVLIPSLVMLVFSGGNALVGTALTGVMLTYTFDLLSSPETAFGMVWLTVVGMFIATAMGSDVFDDDVNRSGTTSALLLLTHAQLLTTTGIWATVQFRWIQHDFPAIVLALEKALFAVTPLLGASVLGTWASVASFGASNAPYLLLLAQAVGFVYFWGVPMQSSFIVRKVKRKKNQMDTLKGNSSINHPILKPKDVLPHAACFLLSPVCSYLFSRRSSLLSGNSIGDFFEHASSVVILISFPAVFMAMYWREGGLRWAGVEGVSNGNMSNQSDENNKADEALSVANEFGFTEKKNSKINSSGSTASRNVKLLATLAAIVSSALLIGGVLGKIVSSGFHEYVKVPSPYGYLCVGGCVYGFLLFSVSSFSERLVRKSVPLFLKTATLTLSLVSGVAAVGVPFWMWPAAVICAVGLARFASVETSNKFTDYLLFVFGAVCICYSFLDANFGQLDVDLDGFPLQELTRFMLVNITGCLVIPGLALQSFAENNSKNKNTQKVSPKAFGTLIALHALMFARCEGALHATTQEDGTTMYPPYLVVLTSYLGFKAVDTLHKMNALTELTEWFAKVIYFVKIGCVFVPGEDSLVPLVLVGLAASSYTVGGLQSSSGVDSSNGSNTQMRNLIPEDAARVFLIVGALVHARFIFFDVAFMVSGHRPSDATLFGGLIVLASVGCMPLVAKKYVHNVHVKRACFFAFAVGVTLILLKPKMPWKGEADGFWYDAQHVPDFEPDSFDVYGDRALGVDGGVLRYGNVKEGWPLWALGFSVMAGIHAATSKGAGDIVVGANSHRGFGFMTGYTVTIRSVLSILGGLSFGAWLTTETFPGSNLDLKVPLSLACGSFGWLVAHINSPETSAEVAGPYAWSAFAVTAVFVVCAWWSQYRDGVSTYIIDSVDTYGFQSDERLRRDDAIVGVVGVGAGLAAQAAFFLKAKAGGHGVSRGQSGRNNRHSVQETRRRHRHGDDSSDDEDGLVGSEDDVRRRRRPTNTSTKLGSQKPVSPFAPFSGRRPAHLRGSSLSLARRALKQRRAEWIPLLGNTAVVIAFLLGSLLAARIAPDPDVAVFLIAPVMLMLHEDGVLFESLSGTRRYAPLVAVVVVQLLGASLSDAFSGANAYSGEHGDTARLAWGAESSSMWRYVSFHVFLAIVATPCAWRFTEYLWSPSSRVSLRETLLVAPLNALVIVAGTSRAARMLAVTSLVSAAAQHLMQRKAKRQGMKAL